MKFDDLAPRAGQELRDAAAGIPPPDIAAARTSRRRRSALTSGLTALIGAAAIIGAVAIWPGAGELGPTAPPLTTTSVVSAAPTNPSTQELVPGELTDCEPQTMIDHVERAAREMGFLGSDDWTLELGGPYADAIPSPEHIAAAAGFECSSAFLAADGENNIVTASIAWTRVAVIGVVRSTSLPATMQLGRLRNVDSIGIVNGTQQGDLFVGVYDVDHAVVLIEINARYEPSETPSTTEPSAPSSTAPGPTLLELGMNTLGVEIAEEDWLVATAQLCADQITLYDAAREFKDLHDLARSDSEIINALREASAIQCPGSTFR